MKKYFSLALFIFLLFYFTRYAEASLLTITKDGKVVSNVLSLTDGLSLSIPETDRFKIIDVSEGSGNEKIYLSKNDGIAYLALGEEGERFDVTGIKEDIVQIEERGDVKTLRIIFQDGNFVLSQDGFNVVTEKPIEIDPKSGKIMIETSSGKVFLGVLPLDAATTVLRSKNITKLKSASLVDTDSGGVVYRFEGEKEVDLFKAFNYSVPVSADLSISTGEIVKIDQPIWLRVLSFLVG